MARHHAPGSCSRCLAMMLSWTSLVPPSIELALVRSQSRAAAPSLRALALPLQRVGAARRHQQLVAALVQLGAVVFQHRGAGRIAPGRALAWSPARSIARRKATASTSSSAMPCAQHRRRPAGRPRPCRSVARRPGPAAGRRRPRPWPPIMVALVRQQVLGHVPAAVQRPDQVLLLDPHVVEEGLAEGRLAADQRDRPGRDARRRHVEQDEARCPDAWAPRGRCAPGRRSSRPCRRRRSRPSGR